MSCLLFVKKLTISFLDFKRIEEASQKISKDER